MSSLSLAALRLMFSLTGRLSFCHTGIPSEQRRKHFSLASHTQRLYSAAAEANDCSCVGRSEVKAEE